jgi:outer membrane protein OmpA-like peptidoglycan-associated protein
MFNRFFIYIFICCLIISCGGKKKVLETETQVEEEVYINSNDNVTIAGSVNFEDEESLTIYSAILKNVIGDKPGAYIGNQMDKLAGKFESEFMYSEMLRAGEGLILEFNTKSDLYFDTGKTSLNASSRNVLERIISVLEQYPKTNIIIETHTDSSGDEAVNQKMTTERVSSIESYLLSNGIKQSRLKSKSFGEDQPKYENDTQENRAKNRRVEFGFYASEALKEEAKNMTD